MNTNKIQSNKIQSNKEQLNILGQKPRHQEDSKAKHLHGRSPRDEVMTPRKVRLWSKPETQQVLSMIRKSFSEYHVVKKNGMYLVYKTDTCTLVLQALTGHTGYLIQISNVFVDDLNAAFQKKHDDEHQDDGDLS